MDNQKKSQLGDYGYESIYMYTVIMIHRNTFHSKLQTHSIDQSQIRTSGLLNWPIFIIIIKISMCKEVLLM